MGIPKQDEPDKKWISETKAGSFDACERNCERFTQRTFFKGDVIREAM